MGEPKNERSFLDHFPPDIWAYLVRYLSGEQLGRLTMTGSTILLQRLMFYGVVKSVTLRRGCVSSGTLPAFLNGLPSLESLSINVKNWPHMCSAAEFERKRFSIPSTVKELVLSGKFGLPAYANDFFGSYLELPPELETLKLSGVNQLNLIVPLLPPSLRNLAADSSERLCNFDFQQLPRCLTSLRLSRLDAKFEHQLKVFALLPPTLTKFKTEIAIPCSAWHLLPSNLKKLSCWSSWATSSVLTQSIVHPFDITEIRTHPFETLPRSITHLELVEFSGDINLLGPPAANPSSYFPPHLEYLSVPGVQLSPEVAQLLPSTLTYLSVDNLCEQVVKHLPRGLKQLVAFSTLMSPNLFRLLPTSLTHLHAVFAYKRVEWYDCANGARFYVENHPGYSTHQKYGSILTANDDHLHLPNLLSLQLNDFPQLDDSFMASHMLPSLRELILNYSSLSDISIPLLSRNLTHLDAGSEKITGKGFPDLPRGLIILNLRSSSSVFDADIQHLPRTLRELDLNYAIHLTNQCVPDFPPLLKTLRLSKSSKITAQVLHFERSHLFNGY